MSFAAINSDIDLRDFPGPEPVVANILDWEFWSYLLFLSLALILWMIFHHKRKNAFANIDPLENALAKAGDNNLPVNFRFQSVYRALRSHLAEQFDPSWQYLTAQELTSAWEKANQSNDVETEDLHKNWIQIESLAYGQDEITETQLESVVTFARNMKRINNRKMKN